MPPFDHQIDQTELQPKKLTKARFRRRIFTEWAHRCAYCADPADTLDHVLPRSKGGLTVAENLVPACRRCNGAKSSTDWREWFRAQAWHCPEREGRIDGWLRGGDPPAGEHHPEHVNGVVS
jgi:5-methylcytosine-specific restriction endonuclease McrA